MSLCWICMAMPSLQASTAGPADSPAMMPEFLPVCLADRNNVLTIRISESVTRQLTVGEAANLPLEEFMLLWKVSLDGSELHVNLMCREGYCKLLIQNGMGTWPMARSLRVTKAFCFPAYSGSWVTSRTLAYVPSLSGRLNMS